MPYDDLSSMLNPQRKRKTKLVYDDATDTWSEEYDDGSDWASPNLLTEPKPDTAADIQAGGDVNAAGFDYNATALRAVPGVVGGLVGAVGGPIGAAAGGALGSSLGEYLAQQYEGRGDPEAKTHWGTVATQGVIGGIPGFGAAKLASKVAAPLAKAAIHVGADTAQGALLGGTGAVATGITERMEEDPDIEKGFGRRFYDALPTAEEAQQQASQGALWGGLFGAGASVGGQGLSAAAERITKGPWVGSARTIAGEARPEGYTPNPKFADAENMLRGYEVEQIPDVDAKGNRLLKPELRDALENARNDGTYDPYEPVISGPQVGGRRFSQAETDLEALLEGAWSGKPVEQPKPYESPLLNGDPLPTPEVPVNPAYGIDGGLTPAENAQWAAARREYIRQQASANDPYLSGPENLSERTLWEQYRQEAEEAGQALSPAERMQRYRERQRIEAEQAAAAAAEREATFARAREAQNTPPPPLEGGDFQPGDVVTWRGSGPGNRVLSSSPEMVRVQTRGIVGNPSRVIDIPVSELTVTPRRGAETPTAPAQPPAPSRPTVNGAAAGTPDDIIAREALREQFAAENRVEPVARPNKPLRDYTGQELHELFADSELDERLKNTSDAFKRELYDRRRIYRESIGESGYAGNEQSGLSGDENAGAGRDAYSGRDESGAPEPRLDEDAPDFRAARSGEPPEPDFGIDPIEDLSTPVADRVRMLVERDGMTFAQAEDIIAASDARIRAQQGGLGDEIDMAGLPPGGDVPEPFLEAPSASPAVDPGPDGGVQPRLPDVGPVRDLNTPTPLLNQPSVAPDLERMLSGEPPAAPGIGPGRQQRGREYQEPERAARGRVLTVPDTGKGTGYTSIDPHPDFKDNPDFHSELIQIGFTPRPTISTKEGRDAINAWTRAKRAFMRTGENDPGPLPEDATWYRSTKPENAEQSHADTMALLGGRSTGEASRVPPIAEGGFTTYSGLDPDRMVAKAASLFTGKNEDEIYKFLGNRMGYAATGAIVGAGLSTDEPDTEMRAGKILGLALAGALGKDGLKLAGKALSTMKSNLGQHIELKAPKADTRTVLPGRAPEPDAPGLPTVFASKQGKDLNIIEQAFGTVQRNLPEYRQALDKAQRGMEAERLAPTFKGTSEELEALRMKHFGGLSKQLEREAKTAPKRKASFMRALAADLRGDMSYAEQQIHDKLPGALGPIKAASRMATGLTYRTLVGWGVDTGAQNLTQPILALSHVKPKYLKNGFSRLLKESPDQLSKDPARKAGAKAWRESDAVMLSKPVELAEEITQGGTIFKDPKIQEAVQKLKKKYEGSKLDPMAILRGTDSYNRRGVFLGAFEQAMAEGGPKITADQAADWALQVVYKTQGATGMLGNNPYWRGPVMGLIRPFTKFPTLFIEHMTDVLTQKGNNAGKARLLGTLGGLALAGSAAGVDTEQLLVGGGGRPFGINPMKPLESLENIRTGKALPVFRGIGRAAEIVSGRSETPIAGDIAQMVTGRYLKKAWDTVKEMGGHAPGSSLTDVQTRHTSTGAAVPHKGWEDLANLLGVKSTRQTETQQIYDDLQTKYALDAAERKRNMAAAKADYWKAKDRGDTEGMKAAQEQMSPRSRRALRSGKNRTRFERLMKGIPEKDRAKFEADYGELLRKLELGG